MILNYGFVLAKGDKGFRRFLKYTLLKMETTITNFESDGISKTLEILDHYVIAKRIKSLFVEFMGSLNEEDKNVIKRIKRGRIRYQDYPSFYGGPHRSYYEKLEETFFRRNIYGNIDKLFMGWFIHSIREQRNISRPAICTAAGYSYPRVRNFETGNALPTLDFLFKFSKTFGVR